MKKTLFTLLLLIGCISATRAQDYSIQTSVMSYLQKEGYTASFDEDKDIIFKIGNYSYYITFYKDLILYPDQGAYTHIQVTITFNSNKDLNDLVNFANECNRTKYNKYLAYSNNGSNYFKIIVESIVTTPAQANLQVKYAIQVFPSILSGLGGHI